MIWFTSRIKDHWSEDWGSLILDCKFGFEMVLRGFEILGFIVLGFVVLGIVVLGFFILVLRTEDPLGFRFLFQGFFVLTKLTSFTHSVLCHLCLNHHREWTWYLVSMPSVLLRNWSPPKFSKKWYSAKQPNQSLSRSVRWWGKVVFQFNKQVRCWAACNLSTLNQGYYY